MVISLTGNPNCGKTTLFNHLTGSNQYVGNWPGVTIEKKEGLIRGKRDLTLQDLPGVYSLSPYTPEEVITRDYLTKEQPDVILNVVDASNLERNLFLTLQLLELGLPVVIALNMMDLVRKSGDTIDTGKLSQELGCPVVEISALKGEGTEELLKAFSAARDSHQETPECFSGEVLDSLQAIEALLSSRVSNDLLRYHAVKLLEGDVKVQEALALPDEITVQVTSITQDLEDRMEDDGESLITQQRYELIQQLSEAVHKKARATGKMNLSDRIDSIVTHRLLALPIFALVMFLLYFISVTTIGTMVTDFTNDTLFSDWIAVPARAFLESVKVASWLIGLVVDGIIAGVGAVLGFVPQMLMLFFLLGLLEDVGYLARVAFIMDRVFRRFGLSGKSFIPMLIGSGCSVPGIMASRTIEREQDRRMTIITTSFIPCSAKMPIIALFAGALYGNSGWVAALAYFIGVLAVVLSGIILRKTKRFAGEAAPFVMELPPYHLPRLVNILRAAWERGWSFIKRAGSVILISSVVLWFLQAFGVADGRLMMVSDNNTSLLALIGGLVAPVFAPLGFGTWQSAVATFTGLIAKENVVGTFGVLYGFAEVAEDGAEIWARIAADFTSLSGASFILFNLLCVPCFAAVGAIRREMNSAPWTAFALVYQTVFAWFISFMVYQLGTLMQTQSLTTGGILALLCFAAFLFPLFRPRSQPRHPALNMAKAR